MVKSDLIGGDSPAKQTEALASYSPDSYLSAQDLAKLTKTSVSFWTMARQRGTGPQFVKLGRAIRYRVADVQAFLTGGAA